MTTILYSLSLSLALASCAVAPDLAHWRQCVNGAYCPADTTCSADGTQCMSLAGTSDGSGEVSRSLCDCEISGHDDECKARTSSLVGRDDIGSACPKGGSLPP